MKTPIFISKIFSIAFGSRVKNKKQGDKI